MESHPFYFQPPRRKGILFHLGIILVLSIIVFLLFSRALHAELGPLFLFFLLSSLFLAVPLPILIFRLYSLMQSQYVIERDGVRLQWGMRAEDIPMTEVLWVRIAEDLSHPLVLPRLSWPGSLVGSCQHKDIGLVEFMAADSTGLILIGTLQRAYAISPIDRKGFLRAFQQQTEMGSISPLRPYSAKPSFLFSELWGSLASRTALVVSVVLVLTVFVWVGLAIPNYDAISLGFSPRGSPLPPVPSVQLLLLPVINVVISAGAFALSIFFQRQEQNHPLAIVLWLGNVMMSLLFILAVYLILQNS